MRRVTRERRSAPTREAAPAPAPKKRLPRKKFLTSLNLDPQHVTFLEKRGARSDKGQGTFNRSRILRRKFDLLAELLERHDPVRAKKLPRPYFDLLRLLIPEPWELRPADLVALEVLVADRPEFAEATAAAGIDPKDLLRQLKQLTFAERAAVADLLEQELAPNASGSL